VRALRASERSAAYHHVILNEAQPTTMSFWTKRSVVKNLHKYTRIIAHYFIG